MSKSAQSLFVFGIYLAVLGVVLVLTPNFLLTMFGLPATSEVWIRVVGMLGGFLAFYDIQAARHELGLFIEWSVYARGTVILFFAAFVALGFVKPILLLFGAIDLAAATWTWMALRARAAG